MKIEELKQKYEKKIEDRVQTMGHHTYKEFIEDLESLEQTSIDLLIYKYDNKLHNIDTEIEKYRKGVMIGMYRHFIEDLKSLQATQPQCKHQGFNEDGICLDCKKPIEPSEEIKSQKDMVEYMESEEAKVDTCTACYGKGTYSVFEGPTIGSADFPGDKDILIDKGGIKIYPCKRCNGRGKVDTDDGWITKLWEEQIKPGYDGRELELFKRQVKKYLPHQK